MRFRLALALALAAGLLIIPASASAAFHLSKISEVHEGGGTGGDYVELQMYASGQNVLSQHFIRTYDSGGAPFTTYQFPSNVANGENQRTVLIGSPIGATPDFLVPGNLFPGPRGSVCFLDSLPFAGIDCVSIGTGTAAPMGIPSPVGSPVIVPGDPAAMGGLATGQSIHRTIEPGCSTLLEAADDSQDSATDFSLGAPSPRPNSTAPTERDCTPDLSLSAKKKQKAGKKIVVKATCSDQDCTYTATGKIKIKGGNSSATAVAKKTFKLKALSGELSEGEETKLKLKLSKGKTKKLKKAVKKGAKGKATVTVKASGPDAEFEPSVEKQKTKLKA